MDSGEIETALDLLKKAVMVLDKSKNPDPASMRSQTERGQVFAMYGKSYAAAGDVRAARDWYGRSKQIFTGLRSSGKLSADGADKLLAVEKRLAGLGKPDTTKIVP